ncbi:MAG: addiction module protein [Burkholderiales bacterium]|nr:addiction module protein [Burkholderiales bacterium]
MAIPPKRLAFDFKSEQFRKVDWWRLTLASVRVIPMNARVDQLFDEARFLGPEERSQLALALLDSIEGDSSDDAAAERAWMAEAHRRLALLASGASKPSTWQEAKARISVL